MSKIKTLPDWAIHPKTFAGMLVEKGDEIEQIVCVIHWKDGSTNVAFTKMNLGDAAWMDYVFRSNFMRTLEEEAAEA